MAAFHIPSILFLFVYFLFPYPTLIVVIGSFILYK
jgi:hypothetical protein